MSLQEEFQNRIQEVRVRFVSRLGKEALSFREFQKQIANCQDADHALGELRAGAHRLHGIAPTFGLDDLGNKAFTVERLVDEVMENPAKKDILKLLEASVNELLLEMGAVFLNAHPPAAT